MLKKTLLTLVPGGLFAGATSPAATVQDEEGTRVDLYGRIAMGVEGGGVEERCIQTRFIYKRL